MGASSSRVQLTQRRNPMSEKIWQAFGPNFVVNTPPPEWGEYQGKREDVITLIEIDHPGFQDHLEGRAFPKAELKEIKPTLANRKIIARLRAAKKEKADHALRKAREA